MTTDILPSHPELDPPPTAHRSPLRLALYAVVVVLVLALIGGVTVAVRGLSGGGSQPEDVLPGGAFAFAKVDLDPSAGQKINALRFMRKFPALKDKVSLDADLREALFEGVADQAGWGELDFDDDVAPWLGSRVAVAAYGPAAGEPGPENVGPVPTIVVALQVRDAGKARAGLDKLVAATPGAPEPGLVIQDGYVLLAQDQKTADKAAKDAEASVLSADENFGSDLGALGDGVAAAWVDMDGLSSIAGMGRLSGLTGVGAFGLGGMNPAVPGGAGRSAYVLRFDGADAVEVRGAVTGANPLAGSTRKLRGFSDLPEDSVVAFGLAGGDQMIPGFFDGLRSMLDDMGEGGPQGGFDGMVADAERELGIELPEDLAVLLGSNLVGALQKGSLGGAGEFELGARVTTDGPRAVAVIDKLRQAARAQNEDFPVVRRLTEEGMIVASTQAQVDRLGADGGLGDRDAVRKALPDVEEASVALWVDFRGLIGEFTGATTVDENLEPIDGIGMTVQMRGTDAATYRLRLVVH